MNKSISKISLINLRNLWVLVVLILTVTLPILFFTNHYPILSHGVLSVIDQHTWVLRLMRWSIIILFVFSWPRLVTFVGKRSNMTDEQLIYWQSAVYRIAIWLVLFELLVGENIIYQLVHLVELSP